MRPNFSIIVLFHNGKGLLESCLSSLSKTIGENDEVIVVVNSPNISNHQLSFDDERIRFAFYNEAMGHAGAANIGAELAKHEYIVFSDHDLIFEDNWLIELWKYYSSSDRLAAVSCCVLNSHTKDILDFGIAYNEFNGAHPFLGLPYKHPLVSKNRRFQAICSGGMLIKKSIFNGLNGFDEKLGTLYSDVDLCFRLKEEGFEVGAAVNAIAYHFGGCFSAIKRDYKSSTLKTDVKGYVLSKKCKADI